MDSVYIPELGVPVRFVRNERARRYVLRVPSAQEIRCTIPRRGHVTEATRFVQAQTTWLLNQLARRRAAAPSLPQAWVHGHIVLYRGESVALEHEVTAGVVRFGDQILPHRSATTDLRPHVEKRMRLLATNEFPRRVRALADQHGVDVARVSVRAQRSRWGSCSHHGAISLNWRLIQAPGWVRDYVIIHELMHRRQMNHSRRFWAEVDQAFPRRAEAEAWLKAHARLLR